MELKEKKNVWTDEFGVKYDRVKNALLKVPRDIRKYAVADGTKVIADAAFSNCRQLKSVKLPDSVVEIGHYAFAGCESLCFFAIPNNVVKIGDGAFMNCRKMRSVRIPVSLVDVGLDVFQGCDNLSSMYFPNKLNDASSKLLCDYYDIKAEYEIQDEKGVEILDSLLHGILDEYGALYDFDETMLCGLAKNVESLEVMQGVDVIRAEALKPGSGSRNFGNLKKVCLPDSISIVGDAAFADNKSLEYINIPKNAVIMSDDNPFANCNNLHTIRFETEHAVKEGTIIYNEDCTELIASFSWLYRDDVKRCWDLLDFARQNGKMQVGSFEYGDAIGGYDCCRFAKQDGSFVYVDFGLEIGVLTPKEIVEQKKELLVVETWTGKYELNRRDYVVVKDKIVELHEGLKKIAAHAFCGNTCIEEIVIPGSLEYLGEGAFSGCTSLKRIIVPLYELDKYTAMLPKYKDIICPDLPFRDFALS